MVASHVMTPREIDHELDGDDGTEEYSAIQPPISWSKEHKEVFEALPPHAQEIIVEREDERTLILRFEEGLFALPMERMFRGRRRPFEVGDTYPLTGFAARVLEGTEEGRPLVVQFQFAEPLEDDSLRWVSWGRGGFVPFALPRIGEKKVLPPVDISALLSEG